MKAVLISTGGGAPTRREIETDGKLIDGMFMRVDGDFIPAAYIFAPEHADKAFRLLTQQYNEEQDLKAKHAAGWNLLIPFRLSAQP